MTTSTNAQPWDPRTDLAWLTALARRLAHPGEDADDLAQETWLVALQQPDRPKGSSRSWLAGVLRNLRRMRARTDRRRHARERDVAPPESVTPEAAMDELETLDALHVALGELDPVDRRLVLGRYAAGRSAVQLAEQLGLPASTVRTRLQRARHRLRQNVESVCGAGCFAPWMLRPEEATVGSSVAGGVAMSTGTKIGLGITVVAVLGIGAQRLTAAPQPADTRAHATAADDGVQTPSRAADPAPSVAPPSAKVEAMQIKRRRIQERRRLRAATERDAESDETETSTAERCDDGCIGTLSMQVEIARAVAGCRDVLPEGARGKTKYRARVIAEPGIGAVLEAVELLENTVDGDFAECVVQSAPLAELSDPEHPIADDFVFRYTVGAPADPVSEFTAAYPDLVLANPDLADLVSRDPFTLTDEERSTFARWIDQDPTAQAAFAKWATEDGLDLAHMHAQ